MYDDAWYGAFVPSAQSRNDQAQRERRQSLLKPTKVCSQFANLRHVS